MSDAFANFAIRALLVELIIVVIVRKLQTREPRRKIRSWVQLRGTPMGIVWGLMLVLLVRHPIVLPTPEWYDSFLRPAGLALALGGTLLATWAYFRMGRYYDDEISVVTDHRVVDDGPFAVVRHPIYLGFLGLFSGGALSMADPAVALDFVAVVALVLFRAREEERLLVRELGDAYRDYRRRVPMFVPWAKPR